jgi:hypothetical protein
MVVDGENNECSSLLDLDAVQSIFDDECAGKSTC